MYSVFTDPTVHNPEINRDLAELTDVSMSLTALFSTGIILLNISFGQFPILVDYLKDNQYLIYTKGTFPTTSFQYIFIMCILYRLGRLTSDQEKWLLGQIKEIGLPKFLFTPIFLFPSICRIQVDENTTISFLTNSFLSNVIGMNVNLNEDDVYNNFKTVQKFMLLNKIETTHLIKDVDLKGLGFPVTYTNMFNFDSGTNDFYSVGSEMSNSYSNLFCFLTFLSFSTENTIPFGNVFPFFGFKFVDKDIQSADFNFKLFRMFDWFYNGHDEIPSVTKDRLAKEAALKQKQIQASKTSPVNPNQKPPSGPTPPVKPAEPSNPPQAQNPPRQSPKTLIDPNDRIGPRPRPRNPNPPNQDFLNSINQQINNIVNQIISKRNFTPLSYVS